MVPHLKTSLTGQLLLLEKYFLDNQATIEAWFRMQFQQNPPPFYSSVDIRNSGFKLAPVDTNLFPAGFNNLNPKFLPLCVHAIQNSISRVCLSACKVLIIPENHTRNEFYLRNLLTLKNMIEHAGLEVKIGSLSATDKIVINLEASDNQTEQQIVFEPLILKDGFLMVQGFEPCVCLLNNDLSSGVPEILSKADQSLFVPPLELGWWDRLKSSHFNFYQQVAQEFAQKIGFDPWLINPLFSKCEDVNFTLLDDDECLAQNVKGLLAKIQKKYDQYQIDKKPFVLIKSDNGTYGMGILVVSSPEQVTSLNRKQRKKMTTNKGGGKITKVILQEGVYTFETTSNNSVCEPVVYLFDKDVVGGFYRVHKGKGNNDNLNSPGMHFEPLSFAEPLILPDKSQHPDDQLNRFYAYGVIARLAMLAAAREINQVLA